MRHRSGWYAFLAMMPTMLVSSGCGVMLWPPEEKLDEIAGAIDSDLGTMDADLADAAAKITETGLEGSATRSTLSELCAAYDTVVDCATIDTQGVIVAVEPGEYQGAEGADISDQPQVVAAQQTGRPVISDLFTAVEGFPAMDFEYPLLDADACIGSVSMLFKPGDYFADTIEPLIEGTGYLCMVVQLDGVILYDVDPAQVGKDTFNDPMYEEFPDLQHFARVYLSRPDGMSTYEFTDSQTGRPVTKYARWTTVKFHGSQWRVLLISEGMMGNR